MHGYQRVPGLEPGSFACLAECINPFFRMAALKPQYCTGEPAYIIISISGSSSYLGKLRPFERVSNLLPTGDLIQSSEGKSVHDVNSLFFFRVFVSLKNFLKTICHLRYCSLICVSFPKVIAVLFLNEF